MMEGPSNGKDGEKKLKNRLMGKLFKEKKPTPEQDAEQDVDSFLYNPSDKLFMMPASGNPPQNPPLTRIDTSAARRWPTAEEINNGRRRRATSPRRSRKGLVVRFTDEQPEVIGEGGDEATSPVADIGARKRAHTHPAFGQPIERQRGVERRNILHPEYNQGPQEHLEQRVVNRTRDNPGNVQGSREQVGPMEKVGSIHGAQTGLQSVPGAHNFPPVTSYRGPPAGVQDDSVHHGSQRTEGHDSSRFVAKVKAEMRAGEGRALVQAASEFSPMNQHFTRPESPLPAEIEITPELNELHINFMSNSNIPPARTIPKRLELGRSHPPIGLQDSNDLSESLAIIPQTSTLSTQEPTMTVGNDAFQEFLRRNMNSTSDTHISRPPIPKPQIPGIPTQLEPGRPRPSTSAQSSNELPERPTIVSRPSGFTMQEVAVAVGDDALQDFSRRSAHLYTLFRLAAEAVKPLPKCSPQQLVRVALWWFLKGRSTLETSIRERPTTPESQHANFLIRQQAHADLAKALWIIETVTSQYPQRQTVSNGPHSPMADLLSSQASIMSSLKKIAISMKRNNILPPEPDDAPLPQGLDNTIWLPDDGNPSLVASQRFNSTFSLSEAFALGDAGENFLYGRLFAEALLLEESASQYYRCHVLLSIIRGQNEKSLTVTVASQDGLFNIGIQNDKARGPTWEEVNWNSKNNTLETKLPRGFLLRLHCAEKDFTAMWELYDLHEQIYAILDQRSGESLVFEATVKTFQQFELTPDAGAPRDSLPNCHLKVFEKSVVEKAATGVRTKHRGFRLALCSNTMTKNLKGVDRTLPPNLPILFGLLRGDGGLPALLLQSSDEKSEHNIVFTFEDMSQRTRLYTILTGVALKTMEDVVAEAPIKSFLATNQLLNGSHEDRDTKCLKFLDWQSYRIINETHGEVLNTKTVLSENLRVVLDFKMGTLTDRVNVGPGELKLRLDIRSSNQLILFRQPQQDMTISVSESQVLKELPNDLTGLLRKIGRYETTRTYTFPSVKELHLFQTALTGFEILFDGTATSFNIARRRMVVPIYKKWDAATTRVQLVQKDRIVQLVAFFEDFSHGECMNFTLKSTDIFESSGRSNKFAIRIVDAKFALPNVRVEGEFRADAPFVCLDMPEYPGEHDDVTIVFDTEADRERFAQGLPAPVRHASRMASIRR